MMIFLSLLMDGVGAQRKYPYSPFAKRPTLSLSDRRRIRAHAPSPPSSFNFWFKTVFGKEKVDFFLKTGKVKGKMFAVFRSF